MDIVEVEREERRRDRNRRLMALIAVGALVVGVELWFLLADGRSDAAEVAVADATIPGTAVPDSEPQPPRIPGVLAVVDGLGDSGSDYAGDPLPLVTQRTTAAGIALTLRDAGGGQFGEMRGGVFMPAGPAGNAVQVVGNDGAVVFTDSSGQQIPAPPWCWSTGVYRLTGVYEGAVSVASPAIHTLLAPLVRASLHIGGQAEGHPFRMLVVHPPEGTTSVSVRFADGTTDTAPVAKGVAVLATAGPPSGEFTLTLEGQATRRVVPWSQVLRDGDPVWTRACLPITGLPDPGSEQPADPDAESVAIREQFATLFQSHEPLGRRTRVLDDDTGVVDAVEEMAGTSGQEMWDDATYVLNDIVFSSPKHAWFSYFAKFSGNNFGSRFGEATRVGGRWRISRATICQDIAWVGGTCQPFVDLVTPG